MIEEIDFVIVLETGKYAHCLDRGVLTWLLGLGSKMKKKLKGPSEFEIVEHPQPRARTMSNSTL